MNTIYRLLYRFYYWRKDWRRAFKVAALKMTDDRFAAYAERNEQLNDAWKSK